ncbi:MULTISPECIES: XVIPCD domain-containing protein [unclassified Lysobacter]|uniref:XVIPCD domain-containing protein n=1 Tax=unclassified Lysobacter TaxID=2635362 RepID=UPI0006FF9272|nr:MULTISPECIES: XVIPCD domain-containing protein [unclassified Lysobacter]KQZ57053.1 hypothetical protein ASD53_11270 [Lysobacter sp. Root559]KRA81994.1 hypothetical protein ASD78_01620 [Lysobacter sp. Root667]KRC34904.1 hypothetical protein ASE10_09460 [Lysobacter sp. Root76]KRD70593.1 hypothetical protein ASE45_01630 [Lysobacter sp. Root96]
MGYEFEKQTFASGKQVTLVSWEDESPTQHGAKLQSKPWKTTDTRASVGFYDSTVEYMRNDWAAKHMSATPVTTPKGSLMLYHNASTNTWHSTDALDIDHVVQWKDHFAAKGVKTHSEAHMAYNDVSNLRMLPAVVNRARDSADNVLNTYGKDSKQWKEWVDERFNFDAKASHPEFDPSTDLARRTVATTSKDWSPDDGRKGLSFDAKVVGKWYEAQLEKQYATTVAMPHPTTGIKQNVHLFYCSASGQLCTRDALDIDHELPFEILAKEMMKYTDNGTASKAQALDAYNETSNLRLVGRSANSSHEWELNEEMTYRDDDGESLSDDYDEDELVVSSSIRDQVRSAMGQGRGTISSIQEHSFASMPQSSSGFSLNGASSSSPLTLSTASSSSPILLNDGRHPDNKLYQSALAGVQKEYAGKLLQPQQEIVASSLVLLAKANNMPDISRVVRSDEGMVYVVRDTGPASRQVVHVDEKQFNGRTVEQNTREVAALTPPTQTTTQAPQSHTFSMTK